MLPATFGRTAVEIHLNLSETTPCPAVDGAGEGPVRHPSDIAAAIVQGVCLLPFIDEARLLAAVAPCEQSLTAEERFRNAKRCEQLFLVPSLLPPLPPTSWAPARPCVC